MSQNVCCVPGCSVTRKDNMVLHRFPNVESNAEKFNNWIANIGGDLYELETNVIVQNRRVCGRHFEDIHKYPNNRLSRLAIPVLHVPGNIEPRKRVDNEMNQENFKVRKCGICLSVDRELSPLRELKDIFTKIASDIENDPGVSVLQNYSLDNIQLCWECMAVLKRVYLFRRQLRKALEVISVEQDDFVSLSRLSSVTLKDNHPHILYVFEGVKRADVDDHDTQRPDDDDDIICGDDYEAPSGVHHYVKSEMEDIFPEVVLTELEPDIHCSRKTASQIKKPKFRIVTDNTNYCFNKIQIKYDEVLLDMKSERESEYFKSKTNKCLKCVLTFPDQQLFQEHVGQFHYKVTQYTCDICESHISTKRHLVRHMQRHFHKYTCTLCDFSCRDKSQRPNHYRNHRRILQCLKCKLKFGRKEFFKHYKEWHEKFICDYCGVSFKTRYSIESHIRKRHTKFECKPCNKRFSRYNGLWFHKKTTHETKGADAAYCVECDRYYPDFYRYKWHLNNSVRHNLRKKTKSRISCPGCDKVFTKNIYMKDHYNLVHLKFYKYRCEACDKNFTRNADLIKHKRRVHEGILPPKNKICSQCGRGFTTNEILNHHIRTHTGERPYACVTCGARFAQNAALRAHQRALHAALAR